MSDVSASSIDWHIVWHGDVQSPVLALVHGFAGSLHSWDYLINELEQQFHLMLIDLPGHGKTPLPAEQDFTLVRLGEALGQLLLTAAEERVYLCGYSLGGRVALHTALYAREAVKGLALIGASPGIANPKEREERRQADEALAKMIREKGSAWFSEYWGKLPLFATQKSLAPAIQEQMHQGRLANSPESLAYTLEHFGVGTQKDLNSRLFELECKLLLMAGSLDTKYSRSNRAFEQNAMGSIFPVKRVEIHGVGHAAHIEAPDLVAQELIEFFKPV